VVRSSAAAAAAPAASSDDAVGGKRRRQQAKDRVQLLKSKSNYEKKVELWTKDVTSLNAELMAATAELARAQRLGEVGEDEAASGSEFDEDEDSEAQDDAVFDPEKQRALLDAAEAREKNRILSQIADLRMRVRQLPAQYESEFQRLCAAAADTSAKKARKAAGGGSKRRRRGEDAAAAVTISTATTQALAEQCDNLREELKFALTKGRKRLHDGVTRVNKALRLNGMMLVPLPERDFDMERSVRRHRALDAEAGKADDATEEDIAWIAPARPIQPAVTRAPIRHVITAVIEGVLSQVEAEREADAEYESDEQDEQDAADADADADADAEADADADDEQDAADDDDDQDPADADDMLDTAVAPAIDNATRAKPESSDLDFIVDDEHAQPPEFFNTFTDDDNYGHDELYGADMDACGSQNTDIDPLL
jgi:hypothetical protein